MSIRWLKNVIVDNVKSTIEIQIGDRHIGDKCYTRINSETEEWFQNDSDRRDDIICQGVIILQSKLAGKMVTYPDGRPYDWS